MVSVRAHLGVWGLGFVSVVVIFIIDSGFWLVLLMDVGIEFAEPC